MEKNIENNTVEKSIPDISVVIPVYNVEQFLPKCVESILTSVGQASMEVLLVDDGSTDRSPKICDEFSEQYPEVRVIHQSNSGASVARNTGILAARGNYVMFVDSDDFLSENAVADLIGMLETGIDIFTYSYYEYYGAEDIQEMYHFNSARIQGGNVFATISPLPMPWLYVISREYLIQNDILMHTGLLDEDEEWTARLFAYEPKVKTLDYCYYYYRRNRDNSLTFNRKVANTLADIEIIQLLEAEKTKEVYSQIGKKVLENKSRQMIYKVGDDMEALESDDAKRVKKKLAPYRRLLLRGTRKDKYFYFMAAFVGQKRAQRILQKAVGFVKRAR